MRLQWPYKNEESLNEPMPSFSLEGALDLDQFSKFPSQSTYQLWLALQKENKIQFCSIGMLASPQAAQLGILLKQSVMLQAPRGRLNLGPLDLQYVTLPLNLPPRRGQRKKIAQSNEPWQNRGNSSLQECTQVYISKEKRQGSSLVTCCRQEKGIALEVKLNYCNSLTAKASTEVS